MTVARGCAGIALTGHLADRFAPLRGDPLATATVVEVPDLGEELAGTTTTAIWSIDAGGGVQWALAERVPDRALVFSVDGLPVLVADPRARSIRIGPPGGAMAVQLVAAVGAPALAAALGALPMHGSSAERDDGAVLVVGQSGAGKSTLLRALHDAGWRPISEDVTVVDLPAEGPARAWPGPPWVRLAPGQPGPQGAAQRPDPTDKVSWALDGRVTDSPTPLAGIVVLGPPGEPDAAPTMPALSPEAAIAVLPPHVSWLSARGRAEAAFTAAVALSHRAPVFQLQVPRRPDWTDLAVELLASA